jgi:hypothetical protein
MPQESLGTGRDMMEFPNTEDALAEVESDEAAAIALLIRPMPSVWGQALAEEYVRPN